MLKLKRAYKPVTRADGVRFLVERLWPRGLSKAKLHLDAWLKDVGPTTDLRQWFSHDPEKWRQFRRRYFRELDSRPEAWQPITSTARRGTVTLESSVRGAPAVSAVNPRGESPASLSQVRAAASSAVPPGSHGLGTAAPSAQSGGPVGWHDISTCNHHWRTAD